MRYSEFLAHCDRGPRAPLYLLYGEEQFLIEEALSHLVAKGREKAGDLHYQVLRGEETDAQEIIRSAQTFPLFSPQKVVVVKGCDRLPPAELEALLSYIHNPSPTTVLIFTAVHCDEKARFTTALMASAVVLFSPPLSEKEIARWIKGLVEEKGYRIADDALLPLQELGDLFLIKNEVDKLCLYCGTERLITLQDTLTSVVGEKGPVISDLLITLSRKQCDRAVTIVRQLLEEGVPPLKILGALASDSRRRGEKGRFPRLLAADSQVKGGGLPPQMVIERLIVDLCLTSQVPGVGTLE